MALIRRRSIHGEPLDRDGEAALNALAMQFEGTSQPPYEMTEAHRLALRVLFPEREALSHTHKEALLSLCPNVFR